MPSAGAFPVIVANFLLFQIGWFACVLGGAHHRPWLGTFVALALVAFHVIRATRPGPEAILVLLSGALGLVFDSALVAAGWVTYASGTLVSHVAPPWIVALWLLLATTLNVSLRWLRRRRSIAVLLGAVGGPLAYWGGARLGAMEFVQPVAASVALALGWAAVTPALVWLAQRFDGFPLTSAAHAAPSPARALGSSR